MIASGGTGGHVFPAIGVAHQWQEKQPEDEIVFAGGGVLTNRYLNGIPWRRFEVPCGRGTLRGIPGIIRGFRAALKLLRLEKPDLVVGFGSYYTFPLLLAARWLKIPIVLHEANGFPGKVNRLMSRFATVTALHLPSARRFMKGDVREVGMPLRKGFQKGVLSKKEARERLGLLPDRLTLLVFGGSQGAAALNRIIEEVLLQPVSFQLIHLTGDVETADRIDARCRQLGIPAYVRSFDHGMNVLLEATDVALSRSGASTLAELVEYEIPAIFVPYPFAVDDHQTKNAAAIVEVEGGRMIPESHLTVGRLLRTINEVAEKKSAMGSALSRLKTLSRSTDLCGVIEELLFYRNRGHRDERSRCTLSCAKDPR